MPKNPGAMLRGFMLESVMRQSQAQNSEAAALQTKFKQGQALHQQGKLADAERIYLEVLQQQPNHFDALHLLGILAAQTRRPTRAVEFIGRAIRLDANVAIAHSNLGNALLELQRPEDALASYDRAIALNPGDAELYNNRGLALQDLKRLNDALASYDRAIALQPDYAEAYYNRSNTLLELQRPEDALIGFGRAIATKPDFAEAYSGRGLALQDLKRPADALEDYDRAITLRPDLAEVYSNRCNALLSLKRLAEALVSCDRAIALRPDLAKAHSNRGHSLKDLKRPSEALESYDRAIALKPDYADAYSNRGNVLQSLKRPNEALTSYDRAIALKADFAEAYNNRGLALQDLRHLEDALASYNKAIALQPEYAEAYWNQSLCLLQMGRFEKGWELYEWRWKNEKFASKPLLTSKPEWKPGEKKRVLVWAEQGIGDELMFGSLISEFSQLCSRLIVKVDARLVPLFSRSLPRHITFSPSNLTVSEDSYDQHISMGSLCKYLRTNESSFKKSRGGYLVSDPDRTNAIRQRLIKESGVKLCGISWCSKNEVTGTDRSIELKYFVERLSTEKYKFVSLQYGDTTDEINKIRSELGIDVICCEQVDNFKDIDGLAALVSACDAVVSIDNITVHLAGALGKDLRALLPYASDWRWLLGRDDSPWYASAKLYRQDADWDWAKVLEKAKVDLV